MTGCNGVFMVPTGFHFEQSRPRNPCGAWAAADCRGIRGFISTTRKFFKNDIYIDWTSRSHQKKNFQRPKKTITIPNTPFSHQTGGHCLSPSPGGVAASYPFSNRRFYCHSRPS
jgi:hypothetical protein